MPTPNRRAGAGMRAKPIAARAAAAAVLVATNALVSSPSGAADAGRPAAHPATNPATRPAAAAEAGRAGDARRTGFFPGVKLPEPRAIAWQFKLEPVVRQPGNPPDWPGVSDPLASDGVVYFGDETGAARALRAADGHVLWERDQGARVYGPPAGDGERVYLTTSKGLVALNRADGQFAWGLAIAGGGGEHGCAVWEPADAVFCGGADGFVYAVDRRTGRERWKRNVAADAPPDRPGFPGADARIGRAAARPTGTATDGATVFQSVFDQSRVVALDATTGRPRWSVQLGGWVYGAAAVGDRHVFVGSQDDIVYCLDKATGGEVWRFKTKGRIESTPAVAGDRVFVPSCDGRLYCLDAGTGRLVWSVLTDADAGGGRPVYSHPIVTDDAVYVAAGEGQVYAVDRATGRQLWKLRPSAGSELFTSPATDGRHLFVTTRPDGAAGEASVLAIGP